MESFIIGGGLSLLATVAMWVYDKSSKLDSRLDAMELHMAAIEKQVVANESLTRSAIQETDTKYALAVQALASDLKRTTELLVEQKDAIKELSHKLDGLISCTGR